MIDGVDLKTQDTTYYLFIDGRLIPCTLAQKSGTDETPTVVDPATVPVSDPVSDFDDADFDGKNCFKIYMPGLTKPGLKKA